MKKRILAALLAAVILLTLAGCANNKADAPAPDTTRPTVTATAETTGTAESDTDTEHTEEKKNSTAEETKPAETTKTQEPSESVTEQTETKPAATKPQTTEKPESESKPAETVPKETEQKPTETKPAETKPSQTESTEQPKVEETKPTKPETPPKQTEEKPKETKPEVTEPPKETEPPTETEPPKVTEPEPTEKPAPFDIDHWIAYAKSYAESKGLVLSNTAVDCWDNPIRAGAHCIYLERDLQSRLNRYAKDEDINRIRITKYQSQKRTETLGAFFISKGGLLNEKEFIQERYVGIACRNDVPFRFYRYGNDNCFCSRSRNR